MIHNDEDMLIHSNVPLKLVISIIKKWASDGKATFRHVILDASAAKELKLPLHKRMK